VTVAALYVDADGIYAGLPGVELWDEDRDARLYAGPHPVVAHPPCARWCQLAGLVQHVHGYRVGDDGGCFEAALEAVRTFGGVLEHPAYSRAWDSFCLPEPLTVEGWTGGLCGGFSAYVEQHRYGHPARKATWLYAFGVELPPLQWGYSHDSGELAIVSWANYKFRGPDTRERMRVGTSSATPIAFRDELLAIARSASSPKPLRGAHHAREARPCGTAPLSA
jgi:hypothetical protein